MSKQTEHSITRATDADAGCWIDGHWGQYATARMVEIASERGWVDAVEDVAARMNRYMVVETARRHIASSNHSDRLPLSEHEAELLTDAADEIEAWLNGHIAQPGYRFGWESGEFFYACDAWWEGEHDSFRAIYPRDLPNLRPMVYEPYTGQTLTEAVAE